MSYSSNGPASAREVQCHDEHICLGLQTSAIMRYFFRIEDLSGKLPEGRNKAYEKFIELFRDEEQCGMFKKFGEFSSYTLYDVLEGSIEELRSSAEVRKLLEGIVSPLTNPQERLDRVKKAVNFFRELNKRCIIQTEYPDTSVPRGILEFARAG